MDAIDAPETWTELGARLDADGLAANELDVRRLVRAARSAGLGGVAADVLADTTAPDVARLRAYAVVSAGLARSRRLPSSGALQRPVA